MQTINDLAVKLKAMNTLTSKGDFYCEDDIDQRSRCHRVLQNQAHAFICSYIC